MAQKRLLAVLNMSGPQEIGPCNVNNRLQHTYVSAADLINVVGFAVCMSF